MWSFFCFERKPSLWNGFCLDSLEIQNRKGGILDPEDYSSLWCHRKLSSPLNRAFSYIFISSIVTSAHTTRKVNRKACSCCVSNLDPNTWSEVESSDKIVDEHGTWRSYFQTSVPCIPRSVFVYQCWPTLSFQAGCSCPMTVLVWSGIGLFSSESLV